MTELFTTEKEQEVAQNFIDEVRSPENILFIVYILEQQLKRVTLTRNHLIDSYKDLNFSVVNDELFISGGKVTPGEVMLEGHPLLVLDAKELQTHFMVLDHEEFIISKTYTNSAVKTQDDTTVIVENKAPETPRVLIMPRGEFVYVNNKKIISSLSREFNVGDKILTPDLMLERRKEQWKVTTFSGKIQFNKERFIEQHRKLEWPQDFPKYRRSPRLNLELPEKSFKIEKIPEAEQAPKGSLLKATLPPLGMLGASLLTTVLSGRNPMMMMSMGLASLMTVTFTVTQYKTEKKDRLKREKYREIDYQRYLSKIISDLGQVYRQEQEILNYQQPSPNVLLEKIENYDSRLYERLANNRDFMQVSIGIGIQPSNLKIESDYSLRDEDEWGTHVKHIVDKYAIQEEVPIPLELKEQTLGLVGNYNILKDTVSNIYLQLSFFHSYRDINFISLVPEKSYGKDWEMWRFLPHFKIQGINTRGIVYNAKTRDMVLSSFYQMLNARKQELNAAGRDKIRFLPHFVFTIFDDSYLAGHGLNEFLAEDLSELGVTVIWCKEDKKLLPETVTALVEIKNPKAGVLLQDNGRHIDKTFIPYPSCSTQYDFEVVLRQMSSLEHMEVEKNAIPERLSLLGQYLVESVEELEISKRWLQAQPNKSIQSMIGWKGKEEFAFWDLHEQVHGPHAIVGGTSGSGKSEFLTTYLIGLAINFSPEDIGMLIIDWKGGGIANTLAELPHFMGSITNLDGAGTARALASINAELKKRQRELAEYGVNNINGYMKLYRERHLAREGVNYPSKPLPHLMLVSDEFAELKENVPEFLDELTSVARIGRSLGVHLILATQKPDGVVNDQIDANSKSKVALKMSDEANSRALIKTGDAAHIINAGRGYLRVGESEVYELFQSGYGGVDYNPHGLDEEQKDERIFSINPSGQWELLYDPREDQVNQSEKYEELPTQLEAVISEIVNIFEASSYRQPDKPWLPNLDSRMLTNKVTRGHKRELSIPLGLLDVPSLQAQEVYNYNLEDSSHTVIFSSPGFGKSVTLQTLVMNLSRQNTPEQVQFNLFDFGTNGLLPIKALPHVADIVTLEENEKLQKMLTRLSQNLSERKATFKKVGVANMNQYESKTGVELPILVNILDSYDGLTANDPRKENIDNILMKVLREGAALGIYLVVTAGRYNAIRMNMMANIQTKMALFLNEESDLGNLFGRDKLEQVELPGRAQIKLEQPLALQVYLPIEGESEVEVLTALDQEITAMNTSWKGHVPDKIPMVGETVSFEQFNSTNQDEFYLGLNKSDAQPEVFELFKGQPLTFLTSSKKQTLFISELLTEQLSSFEGDIVKIDFIGNLTHVPHSLSLGKEEVVKKSMDVKEALGALSKTKDNEKKIIILNGLSPILSKLQYTAENFIEILEETNPNVQYILLDLFNNIGGPMNLVTKAVKENIQNILFAGDMQSQGLVDLNMEQRKQKFSLHEMFYINDENLSMVVLPSKGEKHE